MSKLSLHHLVPLPGMPPIVCDIQPGEAWALVGSNGIGKSTLLHTLARLRQPHEGSVTLNDIPLTTWHQKNLAREIGILFQETNTPTTLTVKEYCLGSRYAYTNFNGRYQQNDFLAVEHALTQMGLQSLKHHALHKLSGGEKKRVMLATLLCQSPPFFLLDEPMHHLDQTYQTQLMAILREQLQSKKIACVMATHDLNAMKTLCQKVIWLKDDRTIWIGDSIAL